MKSMILGISLAAILANGLWMYKHGQPIHTFWYVIIIVNAILFASEEIQEEIRKRK